MRRRRRWSGWRSGGGRRASLLHPPPPPCNMPATVCTFGETGDRQTVPGVPLARSRAERCGVVGRAPVLRGRPAMFLGAAERQGSTVRERDGASQQSRTRRRSASS